MKPQLISKEISWLSFNERVLQEAENSKVPLLERVRFLGIFSSNLDEFFRIRVANLKRLAQLDKKARSIIAHDPKTLLQQIEKIVLKQQNKFDQIYKKILRELKSEGIVILDHKKLKREQKLFVEQYFHAKVRSKIIPIMLDQLKKFPELSDKKAYLAVCLESRKNKKKKYSLIEIPTDTLPRFVVLPSANKRHEIILLDDVIRIGLKRIFTKFEFDDIKAYTVKITKDADFEATNELDETELEKVEKVLKKRRVGKTVRFIYDEEIDKAMLKFLVSQIGLDKDDALIPGATYHNFKDFMKFPDFGLKKLQYKPLPFVSHPVFEGAESYIEAIRHQDVLLHYPYHSFDYLIDFLREASIDPFVSSIKICLYRLADDSSVVNALINAVKNGKKVTVVLELKARFDEEANIHWNNILVQEGVKVICGHPSVKVHSKICLITQRMGRNTYQYAVIGTGNYNEDTAHLYSDYTLFTSNKKIVTDVKKVFDILEKNFYTGHIRHLMVSPFDTRRRVLTYIDREIKKAKEGKVALIFMKMNGLTDDVLVRKLYEASGKGVEVRLIVRGMFCIPEVWQLNKNFTAISIVDRFLEHSRVYVFGCDDKQMIYISSADLMKRNLDKRIEVSAPIYDEQIKKEIIKVMEIQWSDNVKARILNNSLKNKMVPHISGRKIRSQIQVYEYLKKKVMKENKIS